MGVPFSATFPLGVPDQAARWEVLALMWVAGLGRSRVREASGSFLKKRTKKLFLIGR
jgi:hypothetical protein